MSQGAAQMRRSIYADVGLVSPSSTVARAPLTLPYVAGILQQTFSSTQALFWDWREVKKLSGPDYGFNTNPGLYNIYKW